MKTIIITGGSGFIGSALVKHFIKLNHKVINIDKLTYASKKNLKYNDIKAKNYFFFKKNITDRNFLNKIFKKYKPDYIINCAAETHVDNSIKNSKNFISSNILGTYCLLEEARLHYKSIKKKFRFLQISTDEVYGDVKKNHKSKEEDSYNPSSPYSASKASGDLLIKSYIRTYKIPAIITNCCNNFGPNQYPEKLIPTIIYNILNKKPIPIYGTGKNIREWIYVEDHCNALIKIAEKGTIGESYNVGSGTILNNIEIAEKIILNFKKIIHSQNINNKIYFVKDRPGHDLRYCLNSSKIKNELKWKCKSSFDQRINETIIWYINKFKDNYFKNKDFKYRIGLKT
jgi:dTDP-glucose 4,6-dehydratase